MREAPQPPRVLVLHASRRTGSTEKFASWVPRALKDPEAAPAARWAPWVGKSRRAPAPVRPASADSRRIAADALRNGAEKARRNALRFRPGSAARAEQAAELVAGLHRVALPLGDAAEDDGAELASFGKRLRDDAVGPDGLVLRGLCYMEQQQPQTYAELFGRAAQQIHNRPKALTSNALLTTHFESPELAAATDARAVLRRDVSGESMLHWYCRSGKHAGVAALLSRGADAEARNVKGETAAHVAAFNGHWSNPPPPSPPPPSHPASPLRSEPLCGRIKKGFL
jgi:hypothetical protein